MKQIYQLIENLPNFYESNKCQKVLVEFNNEEVLYIIGTVDVAVMEGSIEVWGYRMTPDTPSTTLYSSGLFGLISITSSNKQKAVVLLENSKLSCKWRTFMNTYVPSFSVFEPKGTRLTPPKPIVDLEEQLGCQFDLSKLPISNRRLIIDEQWKGFGDELLSRPVDQPMKILFAGYQNAGKSTMMCYFINKCLQKWNRILVIDFDIGQSEFFVPKCISAFIIDSPLLGPNFTHLIQPYKSYFFGNTDVKSNVKLYLDIVKVLTNDITNDTNLNKLPCFINTMGFVKDEGLRILHNLIYVTSPTDIVQLKFNEIQDLNLHSDVVNDNIGASLSYNLWYFTSLVKNKLAKAPFLKDCDKLNKQYLVTASYFSKCLQNTDVYFSDVTPYRVNICSIVINITDIDELTQEELLDIISANVIALCVSNSEKPCECVGFGFVRNVNKVTGDLYINTPVIPYILKQVNQIQLGKLTLPTTFYTKGIQIFRYVSLKKDNVFNEIVKRQHKVML
ncbi:polynucleotide 5'-hydroxyl-kinase nol9 [Adelges cooleyi]|uniref:polynucleotide 5'-hydroxyl-kinase nol9 n=1 Tax=Adelges cooleyi TaxID=133065 RepID=UPI00217FB5FA|nr:polynucleotide 5'-hydroxyl-kinase nol9 [Adelges cooleyi]